MNTPFNYSVLLYEISDIIDNGTDDDIREFYVEFVKVQFLKNRILDLFTWFSLLTEEQLDKLRLYYEPSTPHKFENISMKVKVIYTDDDALIIKRYDRNHNPEWWIA